MLAEPFDTEDGFRIWLEQDEVATLLSKADGQQEELAFTLGVRSGLRASEIVDVEARDVIDTNAGPRVRIRDSEGKPYRDTPTTESIRSVARKYKKAEGPGQKLVDMSKRTVQRRLRRVTNELAEKEGEMWQHVTCHDLRRTWANSLANSGIDPLLVCDWGGWNDLRAFLEHYRGNYSPDVQRRELSKVSWLSGGGERQEIADYDPEGRIVEGQTVNPIWPHVESSDPNESDEHVLLKNLAVRWLIDRGYPAKSIKDEHYVKNDRGSGGYTDIYAQHDGGRLYIECEVREDTLSRGGKIPLNRGEDVLMFRRVDHDTNGIFQLSKEVKEIESSHQFTTSESIEEEVMVYNRLGDLPEPPDNADGLL